MNTEVMFSHKSDEWETPRDVFNKLDAEFHFDLDPCATLENKKCDTWYSKDDDGLSKSWGGRRVFCNPPYSEISKWVEKAFYEGRKDNTTVVLLIPARTDTKYFHNFIYGRAEIRFWEGRIKFGGKCSAPFPSLVVIFRGAKTEKTKRRAT